MSPKGPSGLLSPPANCECRESVYDAVGYGSAERRTRLGGTSVEQESLRSRLRKLLEDGWLQRRRRDQHVVFEFTDDSEIKANLSDGSFLRFNYDDERIRREGVIKVFWHIVDEIDRAEAEIDAERPNRQR